MGIFDFKKKRDYDPDLDADLIFEPLTASVNEKMRHSFKRRFLKWLITALVGLFLFSFIIPPFSVPAAGPVTSPYSIRSKPDTTGWFDFEIHSGDDIGNVRGTPVFASRAGFVTEAGVSPSFGNYIVLTHFPGLTTVYAHMDSLLVEKGQFVTRSTVIGKMGSTGRSTGNHLHFEVRIFGKAWPPWIWLFHDRTRKYFF